MSSELNVLLEGAWGLVGRCELVEAWLGKVYFCPWLLPSLCASYPSCHGSSSFPLACSCTMRCLSSIQPSMDLTLWNCEPHKHLLLWVVGDKKVTGILILGITCISSLMRSVMKSLLLSLLYLILGTLIVPFYTESLKRWVICQRQS